MAKGSKAVDKRTQELLELKKVLIDKEKKIKSHMKKLAQDSTKGLSNNVGGDDADLASLELSQRTSARIGNRELKLLKKIEHALSKFGKGKKTGEYGICELTGEDIPVARLKARPEAQYTIEAKEELERKEGGFRDAEEKEDLPVDD